MWQQDTEKILLLRGHAARRQKAGMETAQDIRGLLQGQDGFLPAGAEAPALLDLPLKKGRPLRPPSAVQSTLPRAATANSVSTAPARTP